MSSTQSSWSVEVAVSLFLVVAVCLGPVGCTGSISAGDASGGNGPGQVGNLELISDRPAPNRALTRFEYINAVKDLGLVTDMAPFVANFPGENSVDGYKSHADVGGLSLAMVEAYFDAAEKIAAEAVNSSAMVADFLASCQADSFDAARCGSEFARTFLPRAYRRPVTDTEIDNMSALAAEAVAGKPTYRKTALQVIIQATLQSLNFLYRLEEVDEKLTEDEVTPYELASRLSFALWGAPPDDELWAHAEAGDLNDPEILEQQALRLLQDERAKAQVREFFSQWLRFDRFVPAATTKSTTAFPEFTTSLPPKWSQSLLDFGEYVVFEDGHASTLHDSNRIFGDQAFGQVYGITIPANGDYGIDEQGYYGGLLAQPAFGALISGSDRTTPIQRALFILERVICAPIGLPPITPEPLEEQPNAEEMTMRELVEMHSKDPACRSCHEKIDPIGFSMENYNVGGKYRTEETLGNGTTAPIDASATLAGLDDTALTGDFVGLTGSNGLNAKLAQSKRVRDCLAGHYMEFINGQHVSPKSETYYHVTENLTATDGELLQMMLDIVTHDNFRRKAVDVADEGVQ